MPEIDSSHDMSSYTSDSPLTLIKTINHQNDIEHLPTEKTRPSEQVQEIDLLGKDPSDISCPVEKENLPEKDDIQSDQLPLLSNMSGTEIQTDGTEREILKEGKDEMEAYTAEETEEQRETETCVRRSERGCQPAKRLDYPEL